jgi:hypothetical protein
MVHKIKNFSAIGLLLGMLWLTACGSTTPTPAPTLDTNPLRTEVAKTVLAQVARDLARTPSVTPLPSFTVTPAPTSTLTPVTSPSPSATITLSAATPVTGTINLAAWVSQSVADNTIFAPSATFTMTWQLQNVGTSTWTAGYMLRFYSGNSFNAPKEILVGRDVLPGEMVDFVLHMKAPANTGTYQSVWVMATDTRSNFKEPVFLTIIVATAVVPTPTP